MVHDRADVPARLDGVRVEFNEERLVSDAGLLLTATLAERLGLEGLVNESVWLPYRTAGAALPGRKVMTLVHGRSPARTASMTWKCCALGAPARCWGTG